MSITKIRENSALQNLGASLVSQVSVPVSQVSPPPTNPTMNNNIICKEDALLSSGVTQKEKIFLNLEDIRKKKFDEKKMKFFFDHMKEFFEEYEKLSYICDEKERSALAKENIGLNSVEEDDQLVDYNILSDSEEDKQEVNNFIKMEDVTFRDNSDPFDVEENVKLPETFVPRYTSSMTLIMVDYLLSDTNYDEMIRKGYPAYMLSKILKARQHNRPAIKYAKAYQKLNVDAEEFVPKKVYKVEKQGNCSTNFSLMKDSYSKDQVSHLFRIPIRRCEVTLKPARFESSKFRDWLFGQAYYLNKNLPKTQWVVGTESARILFFNHRSFTQKICNELLQSSSVYVYDFNRVDREPNPTYLTDYLSKEQLVRCDKKKSIFIGNIEVTSLEEVMTFQPSFKRHGPIFRSLIQYFSETSVVNQTLLQSSIWRYFPKDSEPQGRSRCPFSMSSVHMMQEDQFETVIDSVRNFTPNINVTHHLNLPTLASIVNNKELYARYFLHIMSFIYSITEAIGWKQKVSLLTMFITGNPIIFKYFSKGLESFQFNVMKLQGDVEDSSYIPDFFYDTVVGAAVMDFFSNVSSQFAYWVGPLVGDLVKETRKNVLKERSTDLIKSLTTWLRDIIDRITQCISKKSLDPIWGQKWDPKAWIRHSEGYVKYYTVLTVQKIVKPHSEKDISELRTLGMISNEWTTPVSVQEYLTRMEAHLEQGVKLVSYFSAYPTIIVDVNKQANSLRIHYDRLKNEQMGSNHRIAPFFLYLFGEPGVGKTNLIEQIIQCIGRTNDIPYSEPCVYDWLMGANFQTNLDHTKNFIVLDDVDLSPAAATAGIKTHCEEIIALVNTKPYPVEQADVNLKGTISANPLMVIQSSNYPGSRASEYLQAPHAFYRRISLHVTVKVKPEYSTPDGRIDSVKFNASETHNMFIFEVSTYEKSELKSKFLSDPITYEFTNFIRFLNERFRAHLVEEKNRFARVAHSRPFCINCGLESSRECGCDVLEFQGNFVTKTQEPNLEEERPKIQERSSHVWDVVPMVRAAFLLYFFSKDWPGMVDFGFEDDDWLRENYCRVKDLVYARNYTIEEFEKHMRIFLKHEKHEVMLYYLQVYEEKHKNEMLTFSQRVHHRYQVLKRAWTRSDQLYCEKEYISARNSLFAWIASITAVVASINVIASIARYVEVAQGRENNSTNGLLPTTWVRAEQKFEPGLTTQSFGTATFTKNDIIACLKDSHVLVLGVCEVNGFCISQNCIITVTHAIKIGSELTISQGGQTIKCMITSENFKIIPSNGELCIVKISSLKGTSTIGKKMWFVVDQAVQTFDEVEIYAPNLKYTASKNALKYSGSKKVLTTNCNTVVGDCGAMYLARFGSTWKIVGCHYALNTIYTIAGEYKESIAGLLTTFEVKSIINSLGAQLQGIVSVLPAFTQYPKDLTIGRFGTKSEIWTAMSHHDVHVFPVGEMSPPLPGSSVKTKITHSLISEDLKELTEEFCGKRNYWKLPSFKGEMRNEKWFSPYSNGLKTQNLAIPDEKFLRLALYDYLNGIMNLDVHGYSKLTEEQALTGIIGSYVNPVAIKTSIGPPYVGSKRHFMDLDRDDGSLVDPRIMSLYDQIREIAVEEIPSVIAVCSMKDEPLKYSKDFPRIFNNLPFSFNLSCKVSSSSWKSFIRSNPSFFESAVGINMTSSECNRVLQHLQRVSPDLDCLYDGDATAMDKSWSGYLFDIVALCIFVISSAINVEPLKNYNMVLALKHIVYYVKGDLFRTFHNPSGNDMTVELNGILISIAERYVHYRMHGFQGDFNKVNQWFENIFSDPIPKDDVDLTFRDNVALITYGDDNLKAMLIPPTLDYSKIWKEEIGIEMLDASKSSQMFKKSLEEISFLKRKFEKMPGVDGFVPPLDKKSMIRMLIMKKDSSLSDIDYVATVSSEFMREAVYHGRGFYDRMKVIIDDLSTKHHYSQNPYYVVPSFDFRLKEIQDNNFSTWSLREPVASPQISDSSFVSYQGENKQEMTDVKFDKGVDSTAEPTQDVGLTFSHDLGTIQTDSAVAVSSNDEQPKYFQSMPVTELNDFFDRAYRTNLYQISNTDTPISVLSSYTVWNSWLTAADIVKKLDNYTYIRGTMQVIVVVNAPPMSYGLYAVTCVPNCFEDESSLATTLVFENCLQTDHCALIDLSKSNNVVLQLPWVASVDYLSINSVSGPTPAGMWRFSLSCIQPVRTAIPGGVTVANITVYQNLLDYEIVVPRFQGKLKPNKAMKEHAPEVHKKVVGNGSKLAGGIASIAEVASSLPVIGSLATTIAKGARMAEDVLSYFGFTRLSRELMPIPITMNSVTNVAHCDGDDPSQGSSLLYLNEISIDPTLSGFNPNDCLSTDSLFSRWTYIKSFDWTATGVSQQILGSIPVTPFYCRDNAGVLRMTTAGYFGLPFSDWRGGMEYRIMIPASKTHRGLLQIFWVPLGSSPSGADVTNLTLNTMVDISELTSLDVTVGFARELPFLRSSLWTDVLPIKPIGATNGFLFFRIINPLVSQSTSADVGIHIFARAKSDMGFYFPRDTVMYTDGVDPFEYNFVNNLVLQGKALGDGDEEPVKIELVPMSVPYPSELISYGEKIGSVRALLQKPSKFNVLSFDGSILIPPYFLTPGSTATSDVEPVWTWQGYFRPLYLGLASSERYKILPKTECWIGAARIRSLVPSSTAYTGTLEPMTFCGPNKGGEFSIPYYHGRKFICGRINRGNATAGDFVKITHVTTSGSDESLVIYYSLGPDIRATCFRMLPGVSFTGTRVTTPWM